MRLQLTRTSLKRSTVVVAMTAVAALTLSACGGSGSAASGGGTGSAAGSSRAGQPQSGGDIVAIATNGEMVGFDPVTLTNIGLGIERAALVMDTLLYRNDLTGEVLPKLAESMTSTDSKVWVLKLRPGVNFSDGTPLDAQAVLFNLNRHTAADSKSTAKSLFADVASMEATGDHEVTFTLNETNGSFPLVLTASSPASLIGSPKALADPAAFATNPVGAGAFVLDNWTRDSEMKFVKNPTYWDTGKPYLNSVTYKPVTDQQTVAASLQSGEAQVGLMNSMAWQQFDGSTTVKLWAPVGGGGALIPNGTRPIGDERVRKAISLAFDPQVTKSVIFPGSTLWDGNTDCIPFAAGSPACTSENAPHQDLEQAKKLVADFVADGGDPTASLIYFQILTDHATYIQDQLKNIGLTITLNPVDAAGLTSAQATGDYDIFYGSTASSGYPTVWNRLYSGGSNWGKVVYPELEDALLKARNASTLDERNQAWQQVQLANRDLAVANWFLPYIASVATATNLHMDDGEFPYLGSTMVYYDTAWLEE